MTCPSHTSQCPRLGTWPKLGFRRICPGPDEGPEDTKASGKKRKKWAHDSEHQLYGIFAIHEKVTRENIARSSMNIINDEALTAELRSACRTYTLQQAEWARAMVIPTPQFAELPLYPKY
jgi:hypothetical protein